MTTQLPHAATRRADMPTRCDLFCLLHDGLTPPGLSLEWLLDRLDAVEARPATGRGATWR